MKLLNVFNIVLKNIINILRYILSQLLFVFQAMKELNFRLVFVPKEQYDKSDKEWLLEYVKEILEECCDLIVQSIYYLQI